MKPFSHAYYHTHPPPQRSDIDSSTTISWPKSLNDSLKQTPPSWRWKPCQQSSKLTKRNTERQPYSSPTLIKRSTAARIIESSSSEPLSHMEQSQQRLSFYLGAKTQCPLYVRLTSARIAGTSVTSQSSVPSIAAPSAPHSAPIIGSKNVRIASQTEIIHFRAQDEPNRLFHYDPEDQIYSSRPRNPHVHHPQPIATRARAHFHPWYYHNPHQSDRYQQC